MKSKTKIAAVLFVLVCFVLSLGHSYSQNLSKESANRINVELKNGHLLVFHNNKETAEILSFNFNFTPPKSISILKKSENKILLKAIYPPVAKYKEAKENLVDTITIYKNENYLRFYCNPSWAQNVTIRLKDLDEHYFGVLEHLYPNNQKSPDLRGTTVDVEVLGSDNQYHENYASVWSAFYMSSNGYASFFDSFAQGKYQFAVNGITKLYHHTGKLNWYLFYGPTGNKILSSYYSVIGHPKHVPIWACGPIIWRDEDKNGKEDVINDAQKMTQLKIPLTALMVDRPYSNGADQWSKMDFNSKFSNPKEWISELNNKYGMQFLTWVGPLTFSDKDFPGLLPNYKGYIDLTNPKAVKEFENRLKKFQYSVNVRGHKMDRADEDFPSTALWYDKTPEPEHRNKYIYLYAKVINKFLEDAYGKDEFNYARAAYQRTQPYLSAVWGGDSRSNWDGLACSIANAIRCGFMGFPVWGSDVGGYLGGRIPESLYARWLEFGTWSGMFEVKLDNAGGNGEDRPPWKYGKNLRDVFREVCEQRMNMLPYIYSAANSSDSNGVLMKPLAYEYPKDKNTYKIWNEYIFGNAFLIAPIYDSLSSRDVYLPEGKWYDYNNTRKTYEGGKTINVSLPLSKTPVFIKSNSVYVTGKIYSGNNKLWEEKSRNISRIQIHFYPGKIGEKTTYNYVDYVDKGEEKYLSMDNQKSKLLITIPAFKEDSELLIKLNKKPQKILLKNRNLEFDWNKNKGIVNVSLEKQVSGNIQVLY